MSKIAVGSKIPKFTLPACGQASWSTADAAGQNLVLFFYPKDMTSGCTLESQNFRDLHADFRDDADSHRKFRQKERLPFELLSDAQENVCKLFDVIKEKNMYGRKYLGIERSTFLIDREGVLRREWRKVKVPGHAREVLEAAQSL
jgi:thioredoxin-dependent peroxiredoxin